MKVRQEISWEREARSGEGRRRGFVLIKAGKNAGERTNEALLRDFKADYVGGTQLTVWAGGCGNFSHSQTGRASCEPYTVHRLGSAVALDCSPEAVLAAKGSAAWN